MVVDKFEIEIVGNALRAIADEMAVVLTRSAYSIGVREKLDFSTALFDRTGQLIVQGACIAVQLGSLPFAMRSILAAYPEGLSYGQVALTNDPYGGGATHLADFVTIAPIYVESYRIGYAAILAHKVDIGGRAAGGLAADSKVIFEEGLRLPPLLFMDGGREVPAVAKIIEANVRTPELVMGDLRGQLAALRVGQERVSELAALYSRADLERIMEDLLDHSETTARRRLAELPDSSAEFTDYIDDYGPGTPALEITVGAEIRGDTFVVDFTKVPEQVPAAINATLCNSAAVALFALRVIVAEDVFVNDGLARALELKTRPGTLADASFPAPVASRGITLYRLWDALAGAMGLLVPELAMAGGDGGQDLLVFSGFTHEGAPFVLNEVVTGSWGANSFADGVDGIATPIANLANTPVELVEAEYPIMVEEYSLVPGSFGTGKFRGGCAVRRSFRVRHGPVSLQLRSDRRNHRPYGLFGGEPGDASCTLKHGNDGSIEYLPSKGSFVLSEGDVVTHTSCGAGGLGAAADRDPVLVLQDIADGFVLESKPGSPVADGPEC